MSEPQKTVLSKQVEESPDSNSATSAVEKCDKLGETVETTTMNTVASEDSEYETLEEDNADTSRSSGSRRSSFSDERDALSDDIAIDEREDGDGQEESSLAKDKKLDDDEDRRNPQYIPKKGTFYEHDDRTMLDENEGQEKEVEANRREKSEEGEKDLKTTGHKKGKVWTEKADRWTHDLYVEDEQKPKSTQELIDTYGYDIRNEEAPPKARRRRRYGRGPNKYTRNWEDEDAYNRSVPSQRRVFHNNKEDFPDLGDVNKGGPKRREKVRGTSKSPVKVHSPPQNQQPTFQKERTPRKEKEMVDKPAEDKEKAKPESPPVTSTQTSTRHSTPTSNNIPSPPLTVGLQNRQEKVEKEVDVKVGRGRGFRGTGKTRPAIEFTASRGRGSIPAFSKEPVPQVSESLKHAADMLVKDFSHVYINNNKNVTNIPTNIVEETIIPRSERRSHKQSHSGEQQQAGSESVGGGRSKRYSTQRQRSLPDSTPPPTYSPPHTIPYFTQPPPNSYVPAPVYNEVAPPSVTSPPMQMVAFLPPGPPPNVPAAPPYPPPLLNYMPPPTFPPITLQPPMSGQFEDLSQAAELYQGQSGITYYSTQSQSVVPRPNPPRRVKLAIPIMPPPDKSTGNNKRSNGNSSKQQEVQSAAS